MAPLALVENLATMWHHFFWNVGPFLGTNDPFRLFSHQMGSKQPPAAEVCFSFDHKTPFFVVYTVYVAFWSDASRHSVNAREVEAKVGPFLGLQSLDFTLHPVFAQCKAQFLCPMSTRVLIYEYT